MTTLTQPLRDEHKELLPHLEGLKSAGDAVGGTLTPSARLLIDEAYSFLAFHLLPHAKAEEAALYPAVQKVMGASEATATMSRDHVEVERLTGELALLRSQLPEGEITPAQVDDLRRLLYGLYTLVKVHFAKEEEVYLPLLDARLAPQDAEAMFKDMEAAAQTARAHIPA